MCMINNSYQFVFVHVPKAAGTSVTNALSVLTNYCDLEIGGTPFGQQIQNFYRERFKLGKHSTSAEIRSVMGTVVWARYLKFSFVRNPYDRAYSIFKFLKKWKGNSPALRAMQARIEAMETFEEFVMSGILSETNGPDQMFRPQIDWLCSTKNSNLILVDFVGKVESIDQDLRRIFEMIGAPKHIQDVLSVPHKNRSGEPVVLDQLDEKVADIILQKYRLDFSAFDYDSDPQTRRPDQNKNSFH